MLFSAIWLNIVYVDMSPRGLASVTQRPKGQGGYCVNYLQAACNELLLHVSDLDYEGCKLCSHACSKHYLVTSIRCIKHHLAWPNDKGLARGYSINYLQAASNELLHVSDHITKVVHCGTVARFCSFFSLLLFFFCFCFSEANQNGWHLICREREESPSRSSLVPISWSTCMDKHCMHRYSSRSFLTCNYILNHVHVQTLHTQMHVTLFPAAELIVIHTVDPWLGNCDKPVIDPVSVCSTLDNGRPRLLRYFWVIHEYCKFLSLGQRALRHSAITC